MSTQSTPPGSIPAQRLVNVAVLTPMVAFFLTLGWSYIAGEVLRNHLLSAGVSLSRIGFWATDVPLYAFWAPTALVGGALVLGSGWKRQFWQMAVLLIYYLVALIVLLVAAFLFSPAPIGDM